MSQCCRLLSHIDIFTALVGCFSNLASKISELCTNTFEFLDPVLLFWQLSYLTDIIY